MDILIALVLIVAVAALIYFNRSARSLDINQDGKVDADDAVAAAKNAAEGVKTTVEKVAVRAKTAARSSGRKSTKTGAAKPAAGKKPRTPRK